MAKTLLWIGRLGGIAGVVLCAIAIVVRLRGMYTLAGFQVSTLFLAGIAAMLVGCLGYLALLAERPRS